MSFITRREGLNGASAGGGRIIAVAMARDGRGRARTERWGAARCLDEFESNSGKSCVLKSSNWTLLLDSVEGVN